MSGSVDSLLDQAFTTLLGKAMRDIEEQAQEQRTASIVFEWSGGGAPLSLAALDPILIEVPFESDIVWVHLYSGDGSGNAMACSATLQFDVRSFDAMLGSNSLSGTGATPSLVAAPTANVNLTNWVTHFTGNETIIARVTSFTGQATWLAAVIRIRSALVPQSITRLTSSGNGVVDSGGNVVIFRSRN